MHGRSLPADPSDARRQQRLATRCGRDPEKQTAAITTPDGVVDSATTRRVGSGQQAERGVQLPGPGTARAEDQRRRDGEHHHTDRPQYARGYVALYGRTTAAREFTAVREQIRASPCAWPRQGGVFGRAIDGAPRVRSVSVPLRHRHRARQS